MYHVRWGREVDSFGLEAEIDSSKASYERIVVVCRSLNLFLNALAGFCDF